MNFIFKALESGQFNHLYGLTEDDLKKQGVIPYIADSRPGFPCRVTLQDAEPGARLLLLNYKHLESDSPYAASHAIFVTDGARTKKYAPNEMPEIIACRSLSVRAFDRDDMMVEADVVDGRDSSAFIEKMLTNEQVHYIHVHTAKRGCFLAKVERV